MCKIFRKHYPTLHWLPQLWTTRMETATCSSPEAPETICRLKCLFEFNAGKTALCIISRCWIYKQVESALKSLSASCFREDYVHRALNSRFIWKRIANQSACCLFFISLHYTELRMRRTNIFNSIWRSSSEVLGRVRWLWRVGLQALAEATWTPSQPL